MNKNRDPKTNICRISGKPCIHPFIFYGDPDPIYPGNVCLVVGIRDNWVKAEYLGPIPRVFTMNDGKITGGFPVHNQGLFQQISTGIKFAYGRSKTKRLR